MGCAPSTVPQQQIGVRVASPVTGKSAPLLVKVENGTENKDKKKKDKKEKAEKSGRKGSSSSSSSDSSSDEEKEGDGVITKTLLREYLNREINMLTLELTQPEVLLRQLLEQKDQTTNALLANSKALNEQRASCMKEYQDLTNLQRLIQQSQYVAQETWDNEQKEYVAAYNKHKQLEETHSNLEKQSKELDTKIRDTSSTVQSLLKLRKHQDDVLLSTFDGGYGSEREAGIEEYVDKMREFRKNILNTKTQWIRGLDFTKSANIQYWRAVQVWTTVLNQHQPHVRLQYCAYVANYLHAAYTNSNYAVNCMKAHTQIPYFTDKMFHEVETSRRNAYTACQPRYHQTFLQWLWYYQQNAAYLEKWITKTLAQTIEGDLAKVNGYLAIAEADLRAERKKLIIEKVKDKFGDEAESEVVEQEAEVERLSKEVSKMKSIAIRTNVVTVTTGSDSGIDSDEGPPPAPGTKSEEDVTERQLSSEEQAAADEEAARNVEAAVQAAAQAAAAVEHARRDAEAQARAEEESRRRVEEEEAAAAVEEESRRRVEEAKAKIAALESTTELLQREKEEAETAQREALEKKKEEERAAAARVTAEEAAASAAAEQKDQLLKEAQLAAEAAEKAKAEAKKWMQMAEDAAKKAAQEIEASGRAVAEREAAEREAAEAEESARQAKEDLERATASTAAAREEQIEKERLAKQTDDEAKKAEKEARSKEAAKKLSIKSDPRIAEGTEESAPNFQSDIDSIMNDYKASVEQYEKKRGTEETRMDLDLQEKLRTRRKRRRQQMKQKLEEQKLLSAQQSPEETTKQE